MYELVWHYTKIACQEYIRPRAINGHATSAGMIFIGDDKKRIEFNAGDDVRHLFRIEDCYLGHQLIEKKKK